MISGTRHSAPLLGMLCAAFLLGSSVRAQEAQGGERTPEPEITEEQRQPADQLVLLTFYGDPAEDALTQGLGMFAKQYPT